MARDEQLEKTTVEKGGGGSANASTEAGTTPSLDKVPQSLPKDNARSLGDASKETIRHSDDILENDSVTAEQAMVDLKSAHLQYLHENDVDHDMQALGPAGAEEVAKLSELQLVDNADGPNNANQMDVDDQEHPTPQLGHIPPPLLPTEPPRAVPPGGDSRATITERGTLSTTIVRSRLSHRARCANSRSRRGGAAKRVR